MTLADMLIERDNLERVEASMCYDVSKEISLRRDELDYEIQKELMR